LSALERAALSPRMLLGMVLNPALGESPIMRMGMDG